MYFAYAHVTNMFGLGLRFFSNQVVPHMENIKRFL